MLPRPDLRPGLASIAVGAAGNGRVMYVGDVNAEATSCRVVHQLACRMFAACGYECAACRARESAADVNLLRCTRCRAVKYCGRECQAAHWPYHKQVCKRKATE